MLPSQVCEPPGREELAHAESGEQRPGVTARPVPPAALLASPALPVDPLGETQKDKTATYTDSSGLQEQPKVYDCGQDWKTAGEGGPGVASPSRRPSEEEPHGPQGWVSVFLTSWNHQGL